MVHSSRTEWIREARALRVKGDHFNKWLGRRFGKAFSSPGREKEIVLDWR